MRTAVVILLISLGTLAAAAAVYTIWNCVIAYTVWNFSSGCPPPAYFSFSPPDSCGTVPRELFDPAPVDLYLPGYWLGGALVGLGGLALIGVAGAIANITDALQGGDQG